MQRLDRKQYGSNTYYGLYDHNETHKYLMGFQKIYTLLGYRSWFAHNFMYITWNANSSLSSVSNKKVKLEIFIYVKDVFTLHIFVMLKISNDLKR